MRFWPQHPLHKLRTLLRGAWSYFGGKTKKSRVTGWLLFYKLRVGLLLRSRKAADRFPVTYVRLWADRAAYRRIEKLITKAQHSVVIQMFVWKDDLTGRRMAALLLDCAARGVAVEITKESVGDVFEGSQDFLSTKSRERGVWQRFWHHPNIAVTYATRHDHAKVFIIDGQILLLTGMNIGDEYRFHWHDYMVELRGSAFVHQYLTGEARGEQGPVRLLVHDGSSRLMRETVMRLLTGARKSVFLEQAYLSDPEVLGTLVKLSRQGKDVLIILPSHPDIHYHANMLSVQQLMHEGDPRHLKVLLYPGMVHGKVILVDRRRALLGSVNLLKSSIDDMGEVSVLLDGKPKRVLRKLKRILLRDTLRSRSISDPPFFPLIRRLLAWLRL